MQWEKPVIFFDGVCNYCNGAINLVIRHDRPQRFLFATLQSKAGQQILRENNLPEKNYESFILFEKGKIYSKSTAALRVANHMPWYWKWTQLGWIMPRFMRDAIYGIIARNRYKWFGKKETCMIPGPEVRSRFLD